METTDNSPTVPESQHSQMLKSAVELNDIDVQRYNMISDLESVISTLKSDDFKDKLKLIRNDIKDILDRYIRLLKVVDNERKNIEYLDALKLLQTEKTIKISDIPIEQS